MLNDTLGNSALRFHLGNDDDDGVGNASCLMWIRFDTLAVLLRCSASGDGACCAVCQSHPSYLLRAGVAFEPPSSVSLACRLRVVAMITRYYKLAP